MKKAKKRKEKQKKGKKKGKYSYELYITEHLTVFLVSAPMTFGTDTLFFISPPNTDKHTL